jgi:hypothetical protein
MRILVSFSCWEKVRMRAYEVIALTSILSLRERRQDPALFNDCCKSQPEDSWATTRK